jgi:hypothetical protein
MKKPIQPILSRTMVEPMLIPTIPPSPLGASPTQWSATSLTLLGTFASVGCLSNGPAVRTRRLMIASRCLTSPLTLSPSSSWQS